jgi:hypothetical protein
MLYLEIANNHINYYSLGVTLIAQSAASGGGGKSF